MDGQFSDAPENPEIETEAVIDEAAQPVALTVKKHRFGCFSAALLLFAGLLALAALAWFAAMEAGKIPDFYQTVLEIDAATANKDGSKLEQNLVRLQNAARTRQPWRVELTQQQINGWLVSDLPEKFPDTLPEQIQDPRVVIDDDEIKVVFKFVTEKLTGFVVVTADVFCTDIENEVAVKIVDVRSGFVPLPIAPWVDQVTDVIRKLGVPVYWTKDDDIPVAVFTIPEFLTPDGASQNAVVDAISLKKDRLIVAGQTKETVEEVAQAIEEKNQQK